ncbi:hypothetical protein FM113_03215 [Leucobacter sp. 7(1)]|uniref:GNAT family N-acetyltransferase n=1 Tax=Leucobacter sp. 7(1) TaxID=1255613 RepID=UPI00097F30D3|nr:GNAT family N-acetyltransferase [Leucobacter sp. 7(1)]SJN08551.1 hypothetical protein FM113_03215 [Leucobacter sp. 7(1)]
MARYLTETQATADGFHIVHEPDQQRFALYAAAAEPDRRLIGEAHYSFRGAAGESGTIIDFDHTVVHPDFRGTGLSGLLAHHAVTSEVVQGRRVLASCWFIEGYLARHPELLTPDA